MRHSISVVGSDRICISAMVTSILAAGTAGPLSAQTAPQGTTTAEQDAATIVVTAQLRQQSLKDVPIAISAITASDIQRRNVSSLDDLQAAVPSLRLVDIGPGSQRIQLRGVSQYLGLPTVGNYIDEFSINNFAASGTPEVPLIDLARVEVLRGPQPALYGEGSMGGTIRYITANPQLDSFSGNALGELSSVKSGEIGYRLEGMVNVPIVSDKLALRVAAGRREVGGWIDGPLGDDVNDRQITTVRGKLLWEPDDRLRVSVMGMWNESKQDSIAFTLDGTTTAQTLITPQRQTYKLGVAEVSYDFGPVTLLSVTGIMSLDQSNLRDTAAFTNTLAATFGIPVRFTRIENLSEGGYDRWSQELRLTSNSEGRLRYVVGLTYSDGDSDGTTTVTNSPAALPGLSPDQVAEGTFKSEVFAAYGNVDFDMTNWMTLNVGGRYFRDKRNVTALNSLVVGGVPRPGVPQEGSATFETFNPRVGITFKPTDNGIVYVNAARGFRSGGFNTAIGAVNPTFDPESLWTYEVGAKQSFLDGALFVDLALYYQDYRDIQSTNVTNLGSTEVFNAGKASGPGFDLIVQANPMPDLAFGMTFGYNRVRFDTTSVDKFEGDPLDLVPDFNLSTSIDWSPAITDTLELRAHADLNYISSGAIILRQIGRLGFPTVTPTDDRAIANLRLGVGNDRFEGYVFLNNVFNELKILNPAFGAFVEPIFTQPRTIGIGIRFTP
jgi:iron complex outermembrane receptor protein